MKPVCVKNVLRQSDITNIQTHGNNETRS